MTLTPLQMEALAGVRDLSEDEKRGLSSTKKILGRLSRHSVVAIEELSQLPTGEAADAAKAIQVMADDIEYELDRLEASLIAAGEELDYALERLEEGR